MATRVGVVLSGCGTEDGSEINEAVLTLYWIERAGGRAVCMAPDVVQPRVVDHLTRAADLQASPRKAIVESARDGVPGTRFGAAIHGNIVTASVMAVMNAAQRLLEVDVAAAA